MIYKRNLMTYHKEIWIFKTVNENEKYYFYFICFNSGKEHFISFNSDLCSTYSTERLIYGIREKWIWNSNFSENNVTRTSSNSLCLVN